MVNHPNRSSTSPRALIEQTAAELGLEMSTDFVPFSQSRNRAEKNKSLNWRVTLKRNGNHVLMTDYSAGVAHCPAYNLSAAQAGHRNSVMRDSMITHECEHGRAYVPAFGGSGKKLEPSFADVLASLAMDSDVIDFPSFEAWASEFGYDADSRKAEATYRACMDIALKLRAAIGDDGMAKLRDACQDY